MNKLELIIIKCRELYYNEETTVTNTEFDELVDKLHKTKPDSHVLKSVGATPTSKKFNLPFILGSLNKKGVSNVIPWMRKQDDMIFVSFKLDGVSIFAEWEDGELINLATRGDGEVGESLIHKAKSFTKLKTTLDKPITMSARGEAIIDGKLPKEYKTKRNAVGGILRRDDGKFADEVYFRFYELLKYPKMPAIETLRYSRMMKAGLDIPYNVIISEKELKDDKQGVLDWMVNILEEKQTLNYDIDGLVLIPNSNVRENTKMPKNKMAFKIDNLPESTTVTEIEWNVSRTGRVVPIVHISTLEIDGVEINHPTGHNYDYLRRKGIGVGAIVGVVRSGDVIPYIKEVITPAKTPSRPRKCPSCKSILKLEGVDLTCINNKCRAKKIAQVEHFIRTLGAENISKPTLEKLNITSIKKFYNIAKETISQTNGLGDISANTIIQERKKTLNVTKEKLLEAFGIPLIGDKVSRKIIDNFFSTKFLPMFQLSHDALYNKLIDLDGVGPSIAGSFSKNIGKFYKTYLFLKESGLKFVKEHKTKKLDGCSFQLTGSMNLSKDQLKLMILNNGGIISNVNKKLDYLIVADKDSTSTKAKKARELQIKIITEKQLLKMLGR